MTPFLLISGKRYQGTRAQSRRRRLYGVCWFLAKTHQEAWAVQKMATFRCRPLSGKDSPGPRVRPESARMFTGVLLTFLQWPLRHESHGKCSCEQPSIRHHLWCLRCISGKDLLVRALAVLGVTVLFLLMSIASQSDVVLTVLRCLP